MIVDSSAIVAIILGEADAPRYAQAIVVADSARMSAANWLEAAMVVDRRADPKGISQFGAMFANQSVQLVPVSIKQAELARIAWRMYGKGSGHKAQLNFGDCLAYGLAKQLRTSLLFKGDDFPQTDIEPTLKD